MAAKRKTNTNKDLEEKIAELEAKLSKLSEQLNPPSVTTTEAPKPAEVKPAETAKPKPTLPKGSTPKPAEVKPAETAKPKPTLPKGSTPKPQEAPKPKAAETKPTTLQDALENAYMDAPMTDFHQYRAKVTGYTPAPNRYFVRGTAPVGKVPTKNWNDQKATVTGYTQPSDQYFATRARIAYHPPTKRFGSFSGVAMTVQGVALKTTAQETPKPKVSQQSPPPQPAQNDGGKSKQDKLSDYESDYLKRLEQQKIDDAKAAAEAAASEAQAKVTTNKKGGALPKGFEAKPEPVKSSRGTLPKGF
ncbi:MAG: trans-sialidase [Nitrosopumilus sp.]|nr:trans-sialidase [Nitrosopumilus sp.]